MKSLRALQGLTALLGTVPVVTGLLTMMGVHDPIYAGAGIPTHALLDSNLRFFGGVWLGLGLAVYWMVPRLPAQTALFRVVWLAIFLGGIGRLLSMLLIALPPAPFIAFTALEIVGGPAFVAWQARLARAPAA
jgi:hypothetical protein